jgi:hypothetical protein
LALPIQDLPTCSAFSTLRRILEGLSGSGKISSFPFSGPGPVWKIYLFSVDDTSRNREWHVP